MELQAEMLTVKTRAQKESFYKVIPGQILAKLQQGFLNMQHLPGVSSHKYPGSGSGFIASSFRSSTRVHSVGRPGRFQARCGGTRAQRWGTLVITRFFDLPMQQAYVHPAYHQSERSPRVVPNTGGCNATLRLSLLRGRPR